MSTLSHVSPWPRRLTDDPEKAYRADIRRLVARRGQVGVVLFLVFAVITNAAEWTSFPDRLQIGLFTMASQLLVCATGLLLLRLKPSWTWPVILLTVNTLELLVCNYHLQTDAIAEQCAAVLMIFLTVILVTFPWGLRGQLAGSVGAIIGYPLTLGAGLSPALPFSYGLGVLLVASVSTLVGAYLMDQQRRSAFHHGAALESTARFRAAVSGLAVELYAEPDRTRALLLLCARAREIFGTTHAFLLLPRESRLVSVAADAKRPGVGQLSVPLQEEHLPAVRAFLSDRTVVASEGPSSDVERPDFRSVLAVPLAGKVGPIGVLLLADADHPDFFNASEADEARILGILAAEVLKNIDLLERLREANTELRQASLVKDQLLANASHDLRTPLHVIIGYGQLMLEGEMGELSQEMREPLERMMASAHQQLTLVEDLLDLSRFDLDQLTVNSESLQLTPILSEMEFVARRLVNGERVQVSVEPVDPSVWIRADPVRLRQILANLLSNAAKFTDEGTIVMSVTRNGTEVRIAVRDSGIGIDPKQQALIFEPFCQLHPERKPAGAGLGLAIAQRLAQLMNGALNLTSQPGKGSTFCLTLPAVLPSPAAEDGAGHADPATEPIAKEAISGGF